MRLRTDQQGLKDMNDVIVPRLNIEMPRNALDDKLTNFNHRKRVADYLIGRGLGEGSFAKVHVGLQTITGEEVAIKVMNKVKARRDAYVHRNLRREGRILQLTRHPNIVQVYDVLETDNNYYVVTELCAGGDLIDMVTEKGCLSEKEVQLYVTQLVSAVIHLHSKGIVHRDLKVENMLLDSNGCLKLIDFGLSNTIPNSCIDKTVALSTQCGSPAYAAPELLAKKKYGSKADVWSIGVITFALLVGKLPFTVEPFRIPKLCRKMIRGDMNPLPSHISTDCRFFIAQLLNPDPKSRPTAEHVSKLKWIARSYVKVGLTLPTKVDAEIASIMSERHGNGIADVLSCVTKNRPGESLTTYYLLKNRKDRLLNKRGAIRTDKTRNSTSRSTIGSDGNLHHSKTDSENSLTKMEAVKVNGDCHDRNNNRTNNSNHEPVSNVRRTGSTDHENKPEVATRENYLENKVRELKKRFSITSSNRHRNGGIKNGQQECIKAANDSSTSTPQHKIVVADNTKIFHEKTEASEVARTPQKTNNFNSENITAKHNEMLTLPEFTKAVNNFENTPHRTAAYHLNPKSTSARSITKALETLQRARLEREKKAAFRELEANKSTNKSLTQRGLINHKMPTQNSNSTRPFSTPELRYNTTSKVVGENTTKLPQNRQAIDLTISPQLQNKLDISIDRTPRNSVLTQKHDGEKNKHPASPKYLLQQEHKSIRTPSPGYVYNTKPASAYQNGHTTKFPHIPDSTSPPSVHKNRYLNETRNSIRSSFPTSPVKSNRGEVYHQCSIGGVTDKFQEMLNGRDFNKSNLNASSERRNRLLNNHFEQHQKPQIKR